MAGRQHQPIVFTGLRGRDGSTTARISIPPHKAVECLNVDFYRADLARKRGGATDAFALTTNEVTSGVESALFRHVPGADETLAELWKINGAATPIIQRLAAGTAWATITPKSSITTRPQDAWFVTFNGKLYLFADTAVDRLQVFNPLISTTALRYAGLSAPSAAPTVANTGLGSYPAVERYYRVREIIQVSGNTSLISEASDSVAFTPSGSGSAALVTKPADMGEGATHWQLEESADSDGPWYIKDTIAVATTTYSDTVEVEDISSNDLTQVDGDFLTPSSFKYGIADGARLLMAGSWENSLDPSSVYFTEVLGTTSAVFYDDESVPASNRIPLDPKDGGAITGFGGPFENFVVAFKQRQIWRLHPTGIEEDPYRRKSVSKVVGSIRQQAVVMAEDESGLPTLYFLTHLGPYRYNLARGLQKLVWDIKDIWDTVNLGATAVTCHGVYHSDKHQIWWWVATGASNEPDTKIVFDTRLGRVMDAGDVRDGWCKHDGDSASARCSVMFSNTLGSTMSRDLKPYIGQHELPGRLWKCDTADTDDAGTEFQGLVTFADRHAGGLDHACIMRTPMILGAATNAEVTVSMTANYGALPSVSNTVSMAAEGNETRVLRKVEGCEHGEADVFAIAVAVGDAEASDATWTLDALIVPAERREELVL
jgi:hypothetical protein